jgi:hypothetical protein
MLDTIPIPKKKTSGAFRQAQEVVRLFAVGLGLQVFVVVSADGDDHV